MPVSSKINPDIKEERDKIQFNIEEFTNWFHGGKEKVEEKQFLGKKFKTLVITKFNELNQQKTIFLMILNYKTKCQQAT